MLFIFRFQKRATKVSFALNSAIYSGIGLMSGTSCDGLDLVEVQFTQENSQWSFKIVRSAHYDFPQKLLSLLQLAEKQSSLDLVQCDLEFARFSANSVNNFRATFHSKATFIGSHGHTIFHQPERGITLQIGSGGIIASLTELDTVSDFRTQNVALKGQGAPLVPMADSHLFSQYDCTLNLGGFSNLAVLDSPISGFDISPCNMLLNLLSNRLGQPFDAGGEFAARGRVYKPLLEALNSLPFYAQTPPKSLGKEWFEAEVVPLLDESDISAEDALATSSEHIAEQIAKHLDPFSTCLVSGGGAFNADLINRIRAKCETELVIPDPELIEYKEAVDFAFLGLLRILKEKNVSGSVTGSGLDHCAGAVYLAQ